MSSPDGWVLIEDTRDVECAYCSTPLPAGTDHYRNSANHEAEENCCLSCWDHLPEIEKDQWESRDADDMYQKYVT